MKAKPVLPSAPIQGAIATGPSSLNPGGDPLFVPAPLVVGIPRERGLSAVEAEEFYWRENHFAQPYGSDADYAHYEAAYRVGYEGYLTFGKPGMSFGEVEPRLQGNYESLGAELPWIKARPATLAAWRRAQEHRVNPHFQ